jgi:hypothetical protein
VREELQALVDRKQKRRVARQRNLRVSAMRPFLSPILRLPGTPASHCCWELDALWPLSSIPEKPTLRHHSPAG